MGAQKMKNTIEVIKNYIPYNEQERVDKDVILQMAQTFDNLLDRGNLVAHFSGSAFVINKEHTKVLSSFHNIYQSWGLVGGHADGVDDLLKVAESEALEESGLEAVKLLSAEPIAIDILCTENHIKKGKYVPAHLHFVVTYLFEADENKPLSVKEDEHSALEWLFFDELIQKAREPQMKNVYKKIIERLKVNFFVKGD